MGAIRELAHLLSDPDCPGHGSKTAYDHNFRSLRCTFCGHRVRRDGQPVPATRSLPFWLWPKEIGGRAWAKRTRTGSRTRARGLT